ncbi:hypothetical protein GGQ99_005222 [Aminobacter niigataensis]|uniref:Uncharacterized protein n=2 Tax=Aminobacter niigataensis TaxID=83265 RepID=A0ABR6LBY6_9HYPH|nr:hypothetical protein [Aminobacter niigataensis]MBB4653431.1 hypothetical protein [Aminobacter niigataensis]
MEIALLGLSEPEMRQLVRKRKRNNLIVMSALVLFVGLVFTTSFLHLQKEGSGSAPATTVQQPIANQ